MGTLPLPWTCSKPRAASDALLARLAPRPAATGSYVRARGMPAVNLQPAPGYAVEASVAPGDTGFAASLMAGSLAAGELISAAGGQRQQYGGAGVVRTQQPSLNASGGVAKPGGAAAHHRGVLAAPQLPPHLGQMHGANGLHAAAGGLGFSNAGELGGPALPNQLPGEFGAAQHPVMNPRYPAGVSLSVSDGMLDLAGVGMLPAQFPGGLSAPLQLLGGPGHQQQFALGLAGPQQHPQQEIYGTMQNLVQQQQQQHTMLFDQPGPDLQEDMALHSRSMEELGRPRLGSHFVGVAGSSSSCCWRFGCCHQPGHGAVRSPSTLHGSLLLLLGMRGLMPTGADSPSSG